MANVDHKLEINCGVKIPINIFENWTKCPKDFCPTHEIGGRMDNTTYRIVDAETETTIAYGMHRDAALDLLGMLMRWNAGVKIWMVQVDYCEEEHNRPQKDNDDRTAIDILASAPTDAEILFGKQEEKK